MPLRLKFLRGVPLLALGLLTLSGCAQKPAAVEPPPPKVEVSHPVTRELTDEDDYNGWLKASAEVEVRARVRGHIQKVHFKDGDFVQPEQLLFELDPRTFQVKIDQTTAQMKAYEAQKLAALADVARYSELIKSGGASKQQLEQAQADAASFDAQIAAKMEEVKQSQLDLEFSRITSPIAGRISRASSPRGTWSMPGGATRC